MAVRNCREIGENLQKIVTRLMANDDLVKLLYYNDKDPLSHQSLTNQQKAELIFEKLIKITPRVGPKETANSIIIVRILEGEQLKQNNQFKRITISIEVYVPLTQWIFKSSNLRPFAILGQIQQSLNNKTINGLGKMTGGNFELQFVTQELACYESLYEIISYD